MSGFLPSPTNAIALTVTMLGSLSMAPADILTVQLDGSGDYPTIQAAIDAAADDDTVVIGPGTWTESFEVSEKAITVMAETTGATILDGEDTRRPVVVSGETIVRIEGLQIINGSAGEGGGLYVNFGTSLIAVDCTFNANTSTSTHG